ncbi:MAG: helix-turn-helix domain-containing protein [Wujia sp.]
MEIGSRIKYFRKKKGYTVNKLANMAGVSQSYLRDVELGNKNPTVSFLSLLCDALDITLQEFFSEGTSTMFSSDPLIERIYQLTQTQREALLHFLNTMD